MKTALTPAAVDAQHALILPNREMLGLITIVIADVLNNVSVPITVQNNKLAVQVCATVDAINTLLVNDLTCTIGQ